MARRSAFAFRDFDAERVLQRNFFKNLDLPKGFTDLEILKSLNFNTKTFTKEAESNLEKIERIAELANLYEKKILKHLRKLQRLDGIDTKKSVIFYRSEGKGKLSELINAYSKIFEVVELFGAVVMTEEIDKMRTVMKSIQTKEFGKKLKQFRLSRGYTQKGLAEKLGMSHSGIVAYEYGSREPNLSMLHTLARCLQISVKDFF